MTLRELCDNIIIQGNITLSVWRDGEEEKRVTVAEDNGLSPEFVYETKDGTVRMGDYADLVINYIFPISGCSLVIEMEADE